MTLAFIHDTKPSRSQAKPYQDCRTVGGEKHEEVGEEEGQCGDLEKINIELMSSRATPTTTKPTTKEGRKGRFETWEVGKGTTLS